jgi:TonB-linked SusC/RagA family outer membrane protein
MKKKLQLNGAEKSFRPLVLMLIFALIGSGYSLNASVNEVMQQKVQISGKITDETNEALPGVNVVEKGTSNGIVTGVDGTFHIAVSGKEAILVFSYIGYTTQEIKVGGQTVINVSLKEDTQALDEVVVVSYGQQLKREVTGAIVQQKADKMQDMPVGQFAQQLQGKMAGVQVTQHTGRIGHGMTFKIRGAASLSSGNQPLFVIDGVPVAFDINNINPAEIESFSVLKDAAASALYGSRAANGVILITTRKAKTGDFRIEVSGNYGIQAIPQKGRREMMTAREFAEFQNEYHEDRVKYEGYTGELDPLYVNPERYGDGTNWFDEMTRVAPVRKYDLSLFSANDKSSTSAIFGYFKQEGVVMNTQTQLISLRLNQSYNVHKKVKIGFNLAPSYKLDDNARLDTEGVNDLFNKGMQASPLVAPYDENGEMPLLVNTPPMGNNINPVKKLKLTEDDFKTLRLLANAFVDVEIIDGLNLATNASTDMTWESRKFFQPGSLAINGVANGTSSYYQALAWTSETNLTYQKEFLEDHKIEVLAGFSAHKNQRESNELKGSPYSTDNIPYLSAATTITDGKSNFAEYAMLSYIGRLNYSYRGKYLLSGAVRRDGCSRFGVNQRWGSFPSVSVGWVMSEESFMRNIKPIDMLKVRGSYGITGNFNIGNYTHIATISNYNYIFGDALTPGATIGGMSNSELAWERTKQFNVGFDLSLFSNRLFFTYDYYDKTTDNMIQARPLPRASGFTSVTDNVGVLDFWGHEISVGYRSNFGNLNWNSNFNISFDRNKIKKLVEPGFFDRNNSAASSYWRNQEGHSLGEFFGYIFEGLYKDEEDLKNSARPALNNVVSDVGTVKMRDVSGPDGVPDGKIDTYDRTFIGNPNPKFLFGFTNDFTYKNFDLSISMSGSYGGKICDGLIQYLGNLDGAFNILADAGDRWRSPEDPGSGFNPRTLRNSTVMQRYVNSGWIKNGSYLSVKNITLGYTIPFRNNPVFKNLRVYGSVQNAFVFTNYSGGNPEVSLDADTDSKQIGVDENSYPVPRTFSLGLRAVF